MRARLELTLAGVLAAAAVLAPAASAADDFGPDVRYWPLREIHFPVPVEKIQSSNPKPTKLRFYAAPNRGKFKLASEATLANLDVIDADRGKKGFKYTSPGDGEYDFALQFVFADGDTQPRDDELKAQYRMVVDTHPPVVKVAPSGASGIEWDVQDDNPEPDSVRIEVRWQGSTKWSTAKPGRPLNPRDQYTWQGLTAAQPLEVRVYAKDRAGLDGYSRILTLPTSGGGAGLPTSFNDGRRGGRDDYPNRAEIKYINTRDFSVESKLSKVTRSGVKALHLWVSDGRGAWKVAKAPQPENIGPDAADYAVHIPYSAPKDGLYGFIIIPENGAGGKQDDPRPNDPPQILVEVDTEKPFIKIENVRVSPGGLAGPRVEIAWKAEDKNLMAAPITLEYAVNRNDTWTRITKDDLPNTGRYAWDVEDTKLWKFFVRARATDIAGNKSEYVCDKEVVIDLEKPSAEPVNVHAGASTQARSSPARRDPAPAPPAEAPAPPVPPVKPATTPTPPAMAPNLGTPPVTLPGVAPITPLGDGGKLMDIPPLTPGGK